MNRYWTHIIQFVLLLLFQVLILNNITLNWWVQPTGFPVFTPYIYPLFILLLPFETPVWLLLLFGFVYGSIVDAFMNTPGMHAFALVLMAYLRTNVLVALLPKNMKEYQLLTPSIKTMGWAPFLTYSTFLILIHHSVFMALEIWNWSNVMYLIIKIFASTITSLLLIVVYLLLFTPKASK